MISIHGPRRSRLLAFVLAGTLIAGGWGCSSSPEPAPQPTTEQPSPEGQTAEPEPQAQVPSPADEEAEAAAAEMAAQVSDQDLERFATGVRALAEREQQLVEEGRDLETRRRGTRSPADVVEAQRETLAEMQDAVESEGIDFDAFMQMGQFIRQQPQLLERLEEFLEVEEIEAFYGL